MAMTPIHHAERQSASLAERILAQALEMAEDEGWEGVELTRVAAALDVPATAVLDHYRDLDAVANAWFLRGWHAMLAEKPEGFAAWAARERIQHCLLAWFDALAAHRRVSVEMLRSKAHLPHLHTWVPMVFDLSRTIQWLREAAMLEARYGTRRAQLEEIGLTALFVATLRVWAYDESPGQQDTRGYLDKRLRRAEHLLQWRWGTPATSTPLR